MMRRKQSNQDDGLIAHNLDIDVKTYGQDILSDIADGVPDDRSLMCGYQDLVSRIKSQHLFDALLGIIPGSARISIE